MEPRNGKRSPGRGNGCRSSERQGRRRSRTPIRRRNSRYSPPRRRSRSRSLSPYRSRDLYHRSQRSSSSESRRRGNDDVRRPQFRGPENAKVLEKAGRDRTRIIIYRKSENESASSYDSKFENKRLSSRDRNRVTTNGHEYAGRRGYDRSSTSRDRSSSPLRRNHDSRRNSDGKNNGRDYEYDRNYYDKVERPRTAKERLRGSRDHRAYEKYDDKKSTYKRGKGARQDAENYSKNKEQESENNEVEIVDGSDESNENEEGGQSSASDTNPLYAPMPLHPITRMPFVRGPPPPGYYGPPRPPLHYHRFPPHPRFGYPGLVVPMVRQPMMFPRPPPPIPRIPGICLAHPMFP